MALKRLDEEFELKPGTQLLPYMKRLLPSLEGRFQSVEATAKQYADLIEYIRAAAVLRMNEILIPATEDIIEVTKLGFLLAPSSTIVTLSLGVHYFIVDEGPQRNTFTPSPYLIIERKANNVDYAIARLIQYSQTTGQLDLDITAWHGNAGPHTDWMISSTPGMADSTKIYHDAVGPMHEEVVDSTEQVRTMRDEILAAAEALEAAGIDTYNYVRRDGTIPFTAPQQGVPPPVGSNDNNFATTAWTRSRMIEYSATNVNRGGDTMTGALSLAGFPTQPAHAASKGYVDSIIGQGGIIQNSVTLRTVSPYLRLQSTGSTQTRSVEAMSSSGIQRWLLAVGDAAAESTGNAGSNFALSRYTDLGAFIDQPLWISRQSGAMTTKTLNVAGNIVVTGGEITVGGDIHAFRSATPTMGTLYLNQANTAYHHFDGTNHIFAGGPITTYGNSISCGPISSTAVNTNGNLITSGSHTVNGTLSVTGSPAYFNGNIRIGGAQNYSEIELYDNDWGPKWIHHNGDAVGFLNSARNWSMYTTDAGHIWGAAYGWMHDYITQTASNYAWYAADVRYSQTIQQFRMAYAGDWSLDTIYFSIAGSGIWEPHGNSAVTGVGVSVYYTTYIWALRWRQNQAYRPDWGGWYAVGVA